MVLERKSIGAYSVKELAEIFNKLVDEGMGDCLALCPNNDEDYDADYLTIRSVDCDDTTGQAIYLETNCGEDDDLFWRSDKIPSAKDYKRQTFNANAPADRKCPHCGSTTQIKFLNVDVSRNELLYIENYECECGCRFELEIPRGEVSWADIHYICP